MAVSVGCFQVQSVEEVQLFRLLSGEGCLGGRADAGDVLLNAFEQIECGARACGVTLGLQAHAHDAIDRCVRARRDDAQ